MLIRRNDRTGEQAYLRCYSPRPVPLRTLIAVAGQRWRIEESFQAAKGLTGLDQHQVRRWVSWHRWTTLAMLAHAFLAVATAAERDTQPAPTGLITLTVNEFRRLFDALLLAAKRTLATLLAWSPGDENTNTEPANPTTDAAKTNDHELGGSGAGAVASGPAVGLDAPGRGFPAGSFRFDPGRCRFRFQPPPVKPCVRLSGSKLSARTRTP